MNRRWLAFVSAVALLGQTAWAAPGGSGEKETLYERLGGKKAISALVNDYVDTLASDSRLLRNPKLKEMKSKVDAKRVKSALADRVCHAAGGPCKKPEVVIKNAPEGAKLKAMEWLYVLQDLNRTLDRHDVPARERAELMEMLVNARGNG